MSPKGIYDRLLKWIKCAKQQDTSLCNTKSDWDKTLTIPWWRHVCSTPETLLPWKGSDQAFRRCQTFSKVAFNSDLLYPFTFTISPSTIHPSSTLHRSSSSIVVMDSLPSYSAASSVPTGRDSNNQAQPSSILYQPVDGLSVTSAQSPVYREDHTLLRLQLLPNLYDFNSVL